MNIEGFAKLERTTERAVNAAKAFATGEDVRYLNELSYIVSELRLAAQTLCDPEAPTNGREDASTRLQRLFGPL